MPLLGASLMAWLNRHSGNDLTNFKKRLRLNVLSNSNKISWKIISNCLVIDWHAMTKFTVLKQRFFNIFFFKS